MASSSEDIAQLYVQRSNYYRTLKEMAVNKTPKVLMTKKWVDTMTEIIQSAKKIATEDGIDKLNSDVQYMLLDFDVVYTINGMRLVQKQGKAKQSDRVIVPLEESFELVHKAHISTKHGSCKEMNKWIAESKFAVSIICTPVGISTCLKCLLSPENQSTDQPNTSKTNVPSGLIDLMDMSLLPDNDFTYLLIYQDVRTKFIQLRPITSANVVEELSMELIKIFTDFQPVQQIFIQDNLRDIIDGVLERLNAVFPIIMLNFYEPRECRIAMEIERRLQDWMHRTSSNSWALGCHYIQWEKNSLDSFDGSPFENFLGHILAKNDPVNYDIADIETDIDTPSTSKDSRDMNTGNHQADDDDDAIVISRHDDEIVIPRSAKSSNKTNPVKYHEIHSPINISDDDTEETPDTQINTENPLISTNTEQPIDKANESAKKTKSKTKKPKQVVSVSYLTTCHRNKINMYNKAPKINVYNKTPPIETTHASEDSSYIEDQIKTTSNPNRNKSPTVQQDIISKVNIIGDGVVSDPLSLESSILDYREKSCSVDKSDNVVGVPIIFDVESLSSSNEYLKEAKTLEGSIEAEALKSNVVPRMSLDSNNTIIIDAIAPALQTSNSAAKDPPETESPPFQFVSVIQSLEKPLLKIRKPKVRNKVECVVYQGTDDDETETKRAKIDNPQTNYVNDFNDDVIFIKESTETHKAKENDNKKETTNKQAVGNRNKKQEGIHTPKEMEISVAITALAQNMPNHATTINIASIEAKNIIKQASNVTVADKTLLQSKLSQNLPETLSMTMNVVETAKNLTETTANVIETEIKVIETKKRRQKLKPKMDNNTEIETHTCSTCNAKITNDLFTCRICKNSLHLHCGVGTDNHSDYLCLRCSAEISNSKISVTSSDTTANVAETATNLTEATANNAETATNLTEATANVAETAKNLTETTENVVETVANLTETTNNSAETVTNVAETTRPAFKEPQRNETHICCTCHGLIEDYLCSCCVCNESLHLFCGARIDNKDGSANSICFTCIS